jgi:putative transposase
MRYAPERHHRRSIRLKDCDYTRMGAYFVTLCTQGRVCLFGEIVAGEMRLNEYGEIVQKEWFRSAEIRREIVLFSDEFVVMPNHIHGIVRIVESPDAHVGATGPTVGATDATVGATGRSPLPGPAKRSLASFVAGFKSAVPNASTNTVARPAPSSGNAIITSTSSATRNPSTASAPTF